jgi:hypothetical protein
MSQWSLPPQALSPWQSLSLLHPQVNPLPLRQSGPTLQLAVQLLHAPPMFPHAELPVPATQTLLALQHPVLQVVPLQLVPHWPLKQARCTGQSLVCEQPHVAPPWQCGALPPQVAQLMPLLPQAVSPVPAWHVPPPQQPPLQSEPALHAVPHSPPVQACCVGQSPAAVQPHVAPPKQCGALPPQGTHVPALPHAPSVVPGWHVLPSQHPPLHVSPPMQLVPQTPELQA